MDMQIYLPKKMSMTIDMHTSHSKPYFGFSNNICNYLVKKNKIK